MEGNLMLNQRSQLASYEPLQAAHFLCSGSSLCGLGKDRKGTRQCKKLQELSRKVTNTRQHLRRALQTKAWKDFDHNQAVLDVEQMLLDGAADQRVPLTLVRSTGLLGDDN